jgi:hypothetical protein
VGESDRRRASRAVSLPSEHIEVRVRLTKGTWVVHHSTIRWRLEIDVVATEIRVGYGLCGAAKTTLHGSWVIRTVLSTK